VKLKPSVIMKMALFVLFVKVEFWMVSAQAVLPSLHAVVDPLIRIDEATLPAYSIHHHRLVVH